MHPYMTEQLVDAHRAQLHADAERHHLARSQHRRRQQVPRGLRWLRLRSPVRHHALPLVRAGAPAQS